MGPSSATLTVLSAYSEVKRHIENAIVAANTSRDALGFYAAGVFEEFARKEQLLIAVTGQIYAGHLMFHCRYPRASILQLFSMPSHRRSGVASNLLTSLESTLTRQGFTSIYARVAEDLSESNAYWEAKSYYVQRAEPGGQSRQRTILVRCRELPSPQLFSASGLTRDNPLGLETKEEGLPLFLLDLNVLFDLNPRRFRNAEAINLFKLDRLGILRLAISAELSAELKRTMESGRTDPMQAYTGIFPVFELPDRADIVDLCGNIARMVFPERHLANQLSASDISDIRHLATTIYNRLGGLITSDDSLLRAAPSLHKTFGIQVISPLALGQSSASRVEVREFAAPDQHLSFEPLEPGYAAEVRTLLIRSAVPASVIATDWNVDVLASTATVRVIARRNNSVSGYITWPRWVPGQILNARIVVDESSPAAGDVSRGLLNMLMEYSVNNIDGQLALHVLPHQAEVREVATEHGFRGAGQASVLRKLVLSCVVTPRNWQATRVHLIDIGGPRLPEQPPGLGTHHQHVELHTATGNRVYVSVSQLESLLSPVLFCLDGRSAVITPVQRQFAEPLLGHSPQQTFLPRRYLDLYRERTYLSSHKTLPHFAPGTVILFYESQKGGGQGAIVAAARVQRAYLKATAILDSKDFERSVLNSELLESLGRSSFKTVTAFDNVIPLQTVVPLSVLRKLGCGRPTDLLTTHPINNQQLQAILAAGYAHG
jgi:hypothetical protein